jgi:hypothetical protein
MIERVEKADYNRWLNMAYVISSRDEGGDLLHTLLVNMTKWETPYEKITDSYIFISLRNLHRKNCGRNKIVDNEYVIDQLDDSEEEEIDHMEIDIKNTKKMDFIKRVVLHLRPSDIKLFELHYLTWDKKREKYGFSQRAIARQLNVSHQLINVKINNILKEINEKWDQKNNKKK